MVYNIIPFNFRFDIIIPKLLKTKLINYHSILNNFPHLAIIHIKIQKN